eukprot:3651552-Rhodomonas_salina.2
MGSGGRGRDSYLGLIQRNEGGKKCEESGGLAAGHGHGRKLTCPGHVALFRLSITAEEGGSRGEGRQGIVVWSMYAISRGSKFHFERSNFTRIRTANTSYFGEMLKYFCEGLKTLKVLHWFVPLS